MKKIFLSIFITLVSVSLIGQNATITNSLAQELSSASNSDFIKVNVVFTNQVNHIALNQQLKDKNASIDGY